MTPRNGRDIFATIWHQLQRFNSDDHRSTQNFTGTHMSDETRIANAKLLDTIEGLLRVLNSNLVLRASSLPTDTAGLREMRASQT